MSGARSYQSNSRNRAADTGEKLEQKAIALLEQIIGEAQSLKLPENRIRVQIAAGDILWDRNPGRARGLFSDAGVLISQMSADADRDDVQMFNRLRQQLVLTAARHDSELGYQLLRSTQRQTSNTNVVNGRRFIADQQPNLEQSLLATIAATDPKVAYQKANESLDKGEFPTALNRVLAQLQAKDKEAFTKLSDKTLNRLNPDNLLSNRDAAMVAISLLTPGPSSTSTDSSTNATATNASDNRVLGETAYHDLLDKTVTAALSVSSTGSATVGGDGSDAKSDATGRQQCPSGRSECCSAANAVAAVSTSRAEGHR